MSPAGKEPQKLPGQVGTEPMAAGPSPPPPRTRTDVSSGILFITALPMHMEGCTAQNLWVLHLDTPSFHVLGRAFFIYLHFFLKFEPSK